MRRVPGWLTDQDDLVSHGLARLSPERAFMPTTMLLGRANTQLSGNSIRAVPRPLQLLVKRVFESARTGTPARGQLRSPRQSCEARDGGERNGNSWDRGVARRLDHRDLLRGLPRPRSHR